jgi:hypothetical protein
MHFVLILIVDYENNVPYTSPVDVGGWLVSVGGGRRWGKGIGG